jgi:hypothetical protein
MLLFIFESSQKKKYKKNKSRKNSIIIIINKINKYVAVRKDAGAPKNGQKLVEDVQKYKY